jgi:hypothetical protein
LRLKWLWNSWDKQNRQWKNLVEVHDPIDRALFFSSTYIIIGNGKNTPFWEAKRLHGSAPKDIAPSLFNAARCKGRMVAKKLQNCNWIRNIRGIQNQAMLEEYTMLYMALSSVTLNDQPGEIFWRWMTNGQYSAASVYECQFKGSLVYFPASDVWKTSTEPKCNFFLFG